MVALVVVGRDVHGAADAGGAVLGLPGAGGVGGVGDGVGFPFLFSSSLRRVVLLKIPPPDTNEISARGYILRPR